ncbi:uncharacterized protein [Onthophagus taurus]|uniref:uncharacterized protein n=1 Tax=Onthophagus taurus TaxID=166361 RepID=UPI0039BDF296
MKTVSPHLRYLGGFAAFLGTIQGLTWWILSCLVLSIYVGTWEPNPTNYFSLFTLYHFFQSFTYPITEDFYNISIHESTLVAISAFYLILSLTWLSSSIFLGIVLYRNMYGNFKMSVLIWAVLATVTTGVDIIITIVLSTDLRTIEDSVVLDDATKFIFTTVIGVVMTIFARGYVLLVINFSVAMCFISNFLTTMRM